MARKSINAKTLETEIARFPDLGLAELRTRWKALYGRPAPKFFCRKLLVRSLSLPDAGQIKVHGGLSDATKRRLREIAAAARDGTFNAAMAEPRIKPGTKLVRTRQNQTHTVMVLEDGFAWDGKRYSSLSTIANTITGTSWNGWTFFGLKRSAPQDGRDVLGQFRRPTAGSDGAVSWPRSRRGASSRRKEDRDAANA